ncbi:MAG: transposase [Candidatus Bathyarchaeia archaeon]
MAEAVKAFVGEVWQPTKAKTLRLHEIIDAWRHMTQHTYAERRSVAPTLHSAYSRNRFKSKGKDDPVYFAHYDLMLRRNENKHCKVWVRIPYKPHNAIWLPLRMSKQAEAYLFASRLRDSKLVVGHDGRLWMHFTVTREVTTIQPRAVLAVDLGEKRLATTVLLTKEDFREPRFYGKTARGIRRHYAWLRRRLGERKLLRVIRKVKDTERRKVNTLCHQISHAIVAQAKANNAAIVLGNLKDIRRKARGRRMNRIIANMPYFKLRRQIEYKANWEGIPVYLVSEHGTSKTCHRCGSTDTSRILQSVLECHSCGLVYNADLNGAKNIAKRFWEQAFQNGATGSTPLTLPERNLGAHDEERSYQTKR